MRQDDIPFFEAPLASMFGAGAGARVYLLGFYGYRNLGDDVMLEQLLAALLSSDSVGRVSVEMRGDTLGAIDRRVDAIAGTGAVARLRRAQALLAADCIVWGGGTCLFDEARRGMCRLLRVARAGRLFGKPFVLLNIGLEPFRNREAERLAAEILSHATAAFFRDRRSLALASALAPSATKYGAGGDMALLMAPRARRRPVQRPMRRVGFSGTHDGDKSPAWVAKAGRTLRALAERGAHVVFVPFAGTDERLHRLLAERLPREACTFAAYATTDQCLDILAGLDFHIGQRLHSVVLADVAGTPNIGIAIHPKVRYYLEEQRAEGRCFDPDTALAPEALEELARGYVQPRAFMGRQQALALRAIRAVFAA